MESEDIQLKVGASATITLQGLATSGYQWNFTIDGNAGLVSVSKDHDMPSSNKNITGVNAEEVFTITANKKGTANIHFSQTRSWEKTAAPAKEKNIKVTIE